MLNLADLLQGESEATIANFLHFDYNGSDIIVSVNHDGSTGDTQLIVLEGVNLTTLGVDDQSISQALIANGNLNID
ncbi:type I secretion C-terminal target domain-containing protein [Nitrincola sp. MINF-07-Sa-05]|uniref:type I secretion C-terminal target domain-containing protein n=1 Tax=Nitrincola salilacus TaxID=3400273 RepID=UPI003917FB09